MGHAGIVLHSADGGETWSKQLDGRQIAQLLTTAAAAPGADPSQAAVARQFVSDGPDKPLLDVRFDNARNGILVGAYGLVLRTTDSGQSWQSLMARVDNPKGLHIYAVGGSGDTIYLAGEQGFVARSDDAGNTFTRLETPYRGSFFTLASLPSGEVVIGGLKGNAFWSADHGRTFARSDGFAPVSLSASTVTGKGAIVFADQAGQVYISTDRGRSVRALRQDAASVPLSALLPAADGAVISAGLRGLARVSLHRAGGVQ